MNTENNIPFETMDCESSKIGAKRSGTFKHERQTKKKKKVILSTLDIFISSFIVSPLVIACWRGTWQLIDLYSYYFPPWESFLVGTTIHLIIALGQHIFYDLLNEDGKCWWRRIITFTSTKLYIIVFHSITNLYWRSAWLITDEYFGVTVSPTGRTSIQKEREALLFFPACLIVLTLMKCLRNLTSTPFQICLDYDDGFFLFPNMFKSKINESPALYLLDSTFSVFVVGTLVLTVWRGGWLFLDLYLMPNEFTLSCWTTAIASYVLIAWVFLAQNTVERICNELDGISKLVVADFYMLLAFVGVICTWRGIWGLINIYFIPSDEELSCWLTSTISLVLLSLMGCSNSLLARGVYLDAEEQDGSCVAFTCSYLRDVFVQEKARKLMFWKRGDGVRGKFAIIATKNFKQIKIIESNENAGPDMI
ncbi:uncharacterized protein LOC132703474 isoform X2 [Cylas formicarius]|uniref:uncharacterized protein LOC132703474 isoform X2 n=1 Tax=Cylas formicarius TaxID=197179 RepID=UPI002958B951|nr:uncharacterized protein LOC132703474 isoform X2 [Cylas formicarius]